MVIVIKIKLLYKLILITKLAVTLLILFDTSIGTLSPRLETSTDASKINLVLHEHL